MKQPHELPTPFWLQFASQTAIKLLAVIAILILGVNVIEEMAIRSINPQNIQRTK